MPFHKQYADGSPRPLFRGWLHGTSALTSISLTYAYWNIIPTLAAPTMITICCLFAVSSLVHLVSWPSKALEEAITRVDKSCILALCMTSFMAPQWIESDTCRPDFVFSLVTVAIPIGLGVVGVLCGAGPIAFASFFCPVVSNMWFYGMHVEDSEVFYCIVGSTALYVLGFYLYASQAGGHHPYWGYHEWFHLLVTIGIAINARGVLAMTWYTDEVCSAGVSVVESVVSSNYTYADEICGTGCTGMGEVSQFSESLVWSGLLHDLSWLPVGI
ncbi:expressed unknown protein [Seminavis robusta]|uniref:Uncharacterized protein n=1 Tax=Seminavis robusta TaxID=568900 RepID=A0A9N8DP56_9STRA|nr:expressed unknown protein [Seminavis robusta]|eukprot:Sro192_g082440.1 n/a (272) ;mRNA; r:18669-19484